MSEYLIARDVHITAVALTLVLFVLRGVWMLIDSPMLRRRWVRVVPHVVDTLLLASGVYLAVVIHGYPTVHQGWITGKLIALVLYIGLGTVALKRGRTRRVRGVAFGAALLVFGWIVHTALTRTPWPL